jgi:FlaA1/EpsC-like NDP-sugar epimerase
MHDKIKAFKPKLSVFQSRMIKVMLDFCVVFASFGIATVLERSTIHVDFMPLLAEMIVFSVVTITLFLALRVYRAIWGYISLNDLFYLSLVSVFTICLYFGVREFIHGDVGLDHIFFSQPVITGFVMLAGLAGLRIFYRILHFGRLGPSGAKHNKDRIRVLIIGAGDDAEIFIRSIMNNPQSAYHIVGILDPSDVRQNRTIHSVPVLGTPDQLRRVFAKLRKKKQSPQRIVFTTYHATKDVPIDVLMAEADRLGLKFAQLPSLTEFRDKDAFAPQLKPIDIEDLIGRPQTKIDTDSIAELIKGKRVLITGAGGSIGSELSKQIASFGPTELTLIDNSEYNLYAVDWDVRHDYASLPINTILCDIRNQDKVNAVFKDLKPEVIFHAAALKHVPLVELNPAEGILTNVIGTRNVAEAAIKVKAQAFVQISTDKAVNPTNIMGASKRIGEYYAQALDLEGKDTRFITVRFGNVLGSSGSVVPLFKKQLEAGGPITVTDPNIKRYFMTIKEAVGLVLQASSAAITQGRGERGYIFVLDMGEPLKIMDVARQMIRLADLKPNEDIDIKIIGLRPGEKLYEELFDDSEQQLKTDIPSTFAANPAPLKLSTIKKTITQLEALATEDDIGGITQIIDKIVPGFNHSA